MSSNAKMLQEVTADLALAVQQGLSIAMASPSDFTRESWQPRFTTEVVDYNRFDVTDTDGKQYVVKILEKE